MNQQYRFYLSYYKNCGKDYQIINGELTENATFSESKKNIPLTEQIVVLKTIYPGLVAGVGYAHEWGEPDPNDRSRDNENKSKLADDEIKVGFSLDYVTGLPYIPGASIKGLLKSYFSRYPLDISSMLGCSEEIVKALTKDIFGNADHPGNDIFLDAYPIKPNEDGKLLGIDYITSHRANAGQEYDGLSSPNPVKMLRVLPNVTWLFRFVLNDSCLGEIVLRKEVKIELFKKMMQLYGVGAKTNVGYGRLVDTNYSSSEYKWLECHITEQNT